MNCARVRWEFRRPAVACAGRCGRITHRPEEGERPPIATTELRRVGASQSTSRLGGRLCCVDCELTLQHGEATRYGGFATGDNEKASAP